ncbi:MAG: hypothetical protein DMF61_17255 [Blastocatellia bacterium AA13]|nr:MAG: hypothetical protein DMF61_17255 [Blastocatellia bacterium AA13]
MRNLLRVAVIGVGHFGREHARVYSASPNATLVAVCDLNQAVAAAAAEQLGVAATIDYSELIGEVDAVTVAVPTVDHRKVALAFLNAGKAVLVEKPIAFTVQEAADLVQAARLNNAILQVGHLERFNPAIVSAGEIVTQPRFFEAHRLSPFTPRSLDIDVVMDLMIHDLDIVLSFVKSPVIEVRAAGIPVLTPRTDIANARIEFENGCIANLTASRVSGERVRKLRFFQPQQYVSLDYTAQEATVVSVIPAAAGLPEIRSELLTSERSEPLSLEIESFLDAASKRTPVKVTGEDGLNALRLALTINERVREHALRL